MGIILLLKNSIQRFIQHPPRLVEANVNMVPVIRRDGSSVLHSSPSRPWLHLVSRRIPDLLAPDHVLQVQRLSVVHYPLCDRSSGRRFNSSTTGAHEIDRLATAMVARSRTATVSRAVNLANRSRIALDDLVCAIDSNLPAGTNRRVVGSGIVSMSSSTTSASAARRSWETAFEASWARAFVGHGLATTR